MRKWGWRGGCKDSFRIYVRADFLKETRAKRGKGGTICSRKKRGGKKNFLTSEEGRKGWEDERGDKVSKGQKGEIKPA